MPNNRDSGQCVAIVPSSEPVVVNDPGVFRDRDEIDKSIEWYIKTVSLGHAPWPLFIHGEVGSGKTCAALCLLDWCGGIYHTAMSLSDRYRRAKLGTLQADCYPPYPMCELDVDRQIGQCKLFVLDELGAKGKLTEHDIECVKRVLDLLQGGPLIIISNRNLAWIAGWYGDPIASRICGTVIDTHGDRRQRRESGLETAAGETTEVKNG